MHCYILFQNTSHVSHIVALGSIISWMDANQLPERIHLWVFYMDLDTIPREIIILLQVTFSLSSLSCVCKCVCISVCLCTCICWDRKHVKCKLCRTDCLQSKCTEKHILSTKNYIFLYSHMCVYIYIYIWCISSFLRHCYGLNRVSLKFMFWNPTLQCVGTWRWAFKRWSSLDELLIVETLWWA